MISVLISTFVLNRLLVNVWATFQYYRKRRIEYLQETWLHLCYSLYGVEYDLTTGSTATAFYIWRGYVGLGLLILLDEESIPLLFFSSTMLEQVYVL
ncbi:hypothetical protein BCV72DRAFT_309727 [Rhizopus microsporus var. microsporus]|uniref:EXS domain-containing protein n=1 Tax=Rhizopus microsporus var. microsporus TaxID=86635 RepID=A0A1X0QPV1_RHIZD|nr:hypothetical protein BCV72DRAFT_309727 [Rhizopus microsporus var. microsporus]